MASCNINNDTKENPSEDTSIEVLEDELPGFLFIKISSQTDWVHKDLNATNALKLLKECQFAVHSNWESLARNLDISLEKRRELRIQAFTQIIDYETALEEAIDMFLRNSSSPVTWEKFLSKVESVDRATATKMRKKLGLTQMPDNIKELKRRCDHNILLCISGRIQPLNYVSYFAPESDCDEIRDRCASNDISHLSVNLDMLFKWRERRGPEATYLALIEIFQQTKDEKVIDLITEYVEKGHDCFFSESEDLQFPKVNERMDIPELEKLYYGINEKFAFLSVQIIKSLRKNKMEPKDLATYISISHHYKFTSTDDINDIITKTSSWFNIKVLRSVVQRFGSDKDKEALLQYEQDLHAYLQQSLFHIPAESFQSNNNMSDTTLCYLKFPDEIIEQLNISGEDVLQIERHLADYLQIDYRVFHFCMYRLGCMELVFSIPTRLYQSSVILQQRILPNLSTNEFRLIVDLEDILPSEVKLPTPLNEELHSDYVENEEEFENIDILNGNDSVITGSNGVTIIEDSGFKFVINSESVYVKSRPRQGRKLKRCTNSLLELLEQWILIV